MLLYALKGLHINYIKDDLNPQEYCQKHHKAWYEFYVRIGPEIVKEIAENEKDVVKFYERLKRDMIVPVTELTEKGELEKAFELSVPLVVDYGTGSNWLKAH